MANGNVYDWITERIVKALEAGTVPWRQPWLLTESPVNLVSKKPYRGVNRFSLAIQGEKYTSRFWLTAWQAEHRGGHVRKGEHGSMIVFYKVSDRVKNGRPVVNAKGKPERTFLLRYSLVFNVEQCEGVEYPKPETDNRPQVDTLEACENLIGGFVDCPPITHKGDRAFYRTTDDTITMPNRDTFDGSSQYYSTLFHECVHGTGHAKRLNRQLEGRFGSSDYAREELVAEMGAAFLCAIVGIECKTIDNSAAYIANWLQRLKADSKLVVKAASQAQSAAEYIQGVKAPDYNGSQNDDNVVAPDIDEILSPTSEDDIIMALPVTA